MPASIRRYLTIDGWLVSFVFDRAKSIRFLWHDKNTSNTSNNSSNNNNTNKKEKNRGKKTKTPAMEMASPASPVNGYVRPPYAADAASGASVTYPSKYYDMESNGKPRGYGWIWCCEPPAHHRSSRESLIECCDEASGTKPRNALRELAKLLLLVTGCLTVVVQFLCCTWLVAIGLADQLTVSLRVVTLATMVLLDLALLYRLTRALQRWSRRWMAASTCDPQAAPGSAQHCISLQNIALVSQYFTVQHPAPEATVAGGSRRPARRRASRLAIPRIDLELVSGEKPDTGRLAVAELRGGIRTASPSPRSQSPVTLDRLKHVSLSAYEIASKCLRVQYGGGGDGGGDHGGSATSSRASRQSSLTGEWQQECCEPLAGQQRASSSFGSHRTSVASVATEASEFYRENHIAVQ